MVSLATVFTLHSIILHFFIHEKLAPFGPKCVGVARTVWVWRQMREGEKRTLAVSRKRGNAHNKPQKDAKTMKDEI